MRIVPADPALTGFADLFAAAGLPGLVREALGDTLGVSGLAEQGELARVRYRPTESCRLLWKLAGSDGQPLLVSGMVFHDDTGARLVASPYFQQLAAQVRAATGGAGSPYAYLPDRKLLCSLFPLDAYLPRLVQGTRTAWALRRVLRLASRWPEVTQGLVERADSTLTGLCV